MNFGNNCESIGNEMKPQDMDFSSANSVVWPQQSSSNSAHQEPDNNLLNTSPLSTSSNGNAEMRSNDSGDAEGVWSADIDQAFHEALQIYPPCGRRKIILSDEGKMYGRNELIARYIKIRCGKTRTRKQVSSHIQVLARKKHREEQARIKRDGNSSEIPIVLQQKSTIAPISPSNLQSAPKTANPANAQPSSELNNSFNITADSNMTTIPQSVTQPIANLINSVSRDVVSAINNSIGVPNPWPYRLPMNFNNQLDIIQAIGSSNSSANPFFAGIPEQINQDMTSKFNQIIPTSGNGIETSSTPANLPIASSKLILIGFSAYIEQNMRGAEKEESRIEIVNISKGVQFEKINMELINDKYPPLLQELFKKGPADAFFVAKCWANMNFEIGNEQNSLFAVDSFYESAEKFDISVSTKVCSFGNEVVEKVEIYSPINDDEITNSSGIWHFKLEKSPMCEYMVRFISELKKLQEPSLMNSVLENFTVLQIVTNKTNEETLMVIAFIFEIPEDGEDEIHTNVYRLTESS